MIELKITDWKHLKALKYQNLRKKTINACIKFAFEAAFPPRLFTDFIFRL